MVTPTENFLGLNIMRKCVYKKTNGLCSHPGSRRCCVAEGTRKSLPKYGKSDKMAKLYLVKDEVNMGPKPEKSVLSW